MYLMHVNALEISGLKKGTLPNLNKNLSAMEAEMYSVIQCRAGNSIHISL